MSKYDKYLSGNGKYNQSGYIGRRPGGPRKSYTGEIIFGVSCIALALLVIAFVVSLSPM